MIDSFSGEFRFLSNFYPASVEYEGMVYPTGEHAFQAAKSLRINERRIIQGAPTPGQAKRLGGRRGIVTLRPDWEEVKVEVMLDVLTSKFQRDVGLCKKLLATGDQELIEGNRWHDQVWGNCTCGKHRGIEGENRLGQLLMWIREQAA